MSVAIERKLVAKIGDLWVGATPGLRIQAFQGGKKSADIALGKTWSYYDWASVSKIVFTVTALMATVDERRLKVTDRVEKYVPWFASQYPVDFHRIRDLLTHSAGLTWWKPFYKSIPVKASRQEKWLTLQKLIRKEVRRKANDKLPTPFERKCVYSDLDFLILGIVLEQIHSQPLEEIWQNLADRYKIADTRFHLDNKPKYKKTLYAPTEDCKYRGGIQQGVVHDENTWSLGGVAPQAGLFGPIDDLSAWGLLLRKAMRGEVSPRFPSPATVKKFTTRAIPHAVGDWGLGFMMPTPGKASCGKYFSRHSVGHTGFTGTSLWYDPKQDLLVTILSNRIYPTRENALYVSLRAPLHNAIVESL